MSVYDRCQDVVIEAFNKSNAGMEMAVLGEARKPTLASRLELQERVIIALRDCILILAAELDDRADAD